MAVGWFDVNTWEVKLDVGLQVLTLFPKNSAELTKR